MNPKNSKHLWWIFVCIAAIGMLHAPIAAQVSVAPEAPEKYFGFYPGADGMLFDYEAQIAYLQKLESSSPRLKLEQIGVSPMGKPMYIAFISTAENIKNLPALKEVNRKLALDAALSEADRAQLLQDGRVFVLGTLSMHSEEVAPAQASVLIAYDLATTADPLKLKFLDQVVYMMVPNHNPDGMDLVVNNYKKYKGGKYDGSPLPGVYHKYVGHDNNRDFVTLSQSDTKAIASIYNLNWFPQVMVEKHGMGSTGPRYYVPLNHDPIAEVIDAGLWNWIGIFGSNMIKDMTANGLAGVCQHYMFDNYWIGSTETCLWKNVIAFLTEAAGAKVASPIFIEANELNVRGKGLSEYKKSVNMPLPWPGGWWRLSDIVQYEVVSTLSILETASLHRVDILRFRNDLCKKEVQNGKTQPPYYYILPLKQHDASEWVKLVNLLKEHGIWVYQLTADTVIAGRNYVKGDIVVPMSQPFRPFLKEVMEPQEYPVRHYTPDGEIIAPYDITSWSLPLHMGVTCVTINKKEQVPANFDSLLAKIETPFPMPRVIPETFAAAVFSASVNESYKAAFTALKEGFAVSRLKKDTLLKDVTYKAGSFVILANGKNSGTLKPLLQGLDIAPLCIESTDKLETQPVKMPRIGLIETYFHDMDAGWTRYVLDSYAIPFKILHPAELETTELSKNFDLLIFPDDDKNILMDGKDKHAGEYYISSMPPEFTRGIGKKGLSNVFLFMDNGGTILSWAGSTGIFLGLQEITPAKQPKEEFQLPVSDISEGLAKAGFACPGSLMKLDLLADHPLTRGLPSQIGVFYRGMPVFRTRIPNEDMDRRVIGKFPEKNILLSGYCENQEKVGNQSALVWLKKNKGQMVLFAFSPIFRASTHVAYKLLFNAILLEPLK